MARTLGRFCIRILIIISYWSTRMKNQDSLEWHLAAAKLQLEQRVSLGDVLARPRGVEHVAYFRRMREADIARTNLEYLGYRVVMERRGMRVVLEATHESDVETPTVTKFVTTVFNSVEGAGGTYDGWGAPVAQPE
jgi:hypothetical protein